MRCEQAETRVQGMQWLLFLMNLHYKPERRNGETIDLSVNGLGRGSALGVNRCAGRVMIGEKVNRVDENGYPER
jgi:hypothetical protein